MAHTDHLIVKLKSQHPQLICSEISVCFLVLVHKYEQMTKHLRESSNGRDRHKYQRVNNNL